MTRSAHRIAAVVLLLTATGCGERAGRLDADAALAVALRVREGAEAPCLVVSQRMGAALHERMPWGLYQALITSGFLVDSLVSHPDSVMSILAFREVTRERDEWVIGTSLTWMEPDAAADARVEHVRWRISCREGGCAVSDSVYVGTETWEPYMSPLRPDGCGP